MKLAHICISATTITHDVVRLLVQPFALLIARTITQYIHHVTVNRWICCTTILCSNLIGRNYVMWHVTVTIHHVHMICNQLTSKVDGGITGSRLCGWRRCFVADQLWLMTRIREEEGLFVRIRRQEVDIKGRHAYEKKKMSTCVTEKNC